MSAAQDKEARERLMFGGFAAQSGLDIDHASITSCSPPLPDIRCTINGTPYFNWHLKTERDDSQAARRLHHAWLPCTNR
jgi:hypothetical protein